VLLIIPGVAHRKDYSTRHFRSTAAAITQLVLGVSILLLLVIHFAGVRRVAMFGRDIDDYACGARMAS
jgi:hypothetical protein